MASRLMHALVYGGGYVDGAVGLKHVEVPVPSPGKDELLIKVEAASINPVDWKIYNLRNLLRPFLSRSHPPIPGNDVAGEVVEVGSRVQKFKPGDNVVTVLSVYTAGGLSEYCVAKEKVTVLRPAEVSAAEGAGLPVAGLTALVSLTQYAGLKLNKHGDENGPQKNILVTAASGGVGQYAVQLAKLGGAHVTATCGARNFELVKGLGADEVLDYKTAEGAALVSPSGRRYDAVVHCAPTVPWSVFEPNLAENGVVIDLIPSLGTKWASTVKKITFSKKKLFTFMLTPSDDEGLKFLVGLMKEGKLKTIIDSKHALSKGEEGWSKGVSGHATGKIVIEP
ncbi:chloroplast envelope quinone oxidoreductase homolog [Salvia miltiorrhiza]|uniref:chloroplast envelope quinone oxidoreductase homolog n=1 Tax=Salvia miltiorrhiza TaxID=226208 RepID=UPI0025ACC079|nr:chloroplast envelope quinone oxidoreductase homolog [Salvia miltiorrhiza]